MADFSIDELRILQEHKQSWKKAKGKHNKSQVYKELIWAAYKLPETKALNKQTWTQQKKKYLEWLRKFARARKEKVLLKYGKTWTAKRVIGHKYKEEIRLLAKAEWNAAPGSKAFLEHYQKAVTTVMNRRSEEEREEAESLAKEWNTHMLPDELHYKNGNTLGWKYARQFAEQMWKQCSTRVVILAAWKNEKPEVCCVKHDFNDSMDGIEFKGLKDGGMDPIMNAWVKYSKIAFKTREDSDHGSEDGDPRPSHGKRIHHHTTVSHVKDGIPYLPDYREVGLDRAKALVREFITGHYRIACGNKKTAVPWAKINTSPEELFNGEYVPQDIKLKDPSKLKKQEVERLLDFWKERGDRGENVLFEFHHWINSRGELMEPVGEAPDEEGDSDSSGDEAEIEENDDDDIDERQRAAQPNRRTSTRPKQAMVSEMSYPRIESEDDNSGDEYPAMEIGHQEDAPAVAEKASTTTKSQKRKMSPSAAEKHRTTAKSKKQKMSDLGGNPSEERNTESSKKHRTSSPMVPPSTVRRSGRDRHRPKAADDDVPGRSPAKISKIFKASRSH